MYVYYQGQTWLKFGDNRTLRMRLHLQCYRTISSTTLRADWSMSSWTNERQRRARACCSGSSWTISSPYRYTPMAWNTHAWNYVAYFSHYEQAWFSILKVFESSTVSHTLVCTYLVMNQKVFHVSISLSVCVFYHQLTPAMSDLEDKTKGEKPITEKFSI